MAEESERRCLIATWPCGCIGAVMSVGGYPTPADQAQFYKENVEDGALVENVTHDDYMARGGAVVCKHEPQWGGVEERFGYCDDCNKRVEKKKDGTLRAHKSRGFTCSQQAVSA